MSNPYERVLSARLPRQSANVLKQQQQQQPQQQQKDSRAAAPTKPLSQPTKRRQVEKPRNLRYAVRPRYRFDIPDPPMDPKMLLGKLSTASYAKPFLSDLERDFRASAIPSDPTFGLHANLVDTSLYTTAANLSVEDSTLLHSVMAGRKGGDVLNRSDSRHDSKKPGVSGPSATVAEPWLRHMSYDEYIARDSSAPRQSLFLKDAAAKKRVQEKISAPELQQRRLRGLLQSFDTVKRSLKHPDRRKLHLRPVSVSPILPDFSALGAKFVALEVDKDDILTLPMRARKNPEAAQESERSTATVSITESLVSGQERKYAAVYTPSSGTLEKRKRKREEVDGDNSNKDLKKIHFVDDETYQWVGEYSIREGRFGNTVGKGGLSRSCFAVTEYTSKEEGKSVACLACIGTTWKLRTRAQADGPAKLAKEGLKMTRASSSGTGDEDTKRNILSGAAQVQAAQERERKQRIEMLEQD